MPRERLGLGRGEKKKRESAETKGGRRRRKSQRRSISGGMNGINDSLRGINGVREKRESDERTMLLLFL